MTEDRIVAVGLLTQRDLDVLGSGFRRLFTVEEPDIFSDLLDQLDKVNVHPIGKGVAITPQAASD